MNVTAWVTLVGHEIRCEIKLSAFHFLLFFYQEIKKEKLNGSVQRENIAQSSASFLQIVVTFLHNVGFGLGTFGAFSISLQLFAAHHTHYSTLITN